jgi:Pyruvate/2-oxoacid:ferredoxin oxidoreductase gamma subunit
MLLAMNEPSLRKFVADVDKGGWVLYNARSLPADVKAPEGVHVMCVPFTELADTLGEPRAGNIVMLGALLEASGILSREAIDRALEIHVRSARWLELDRRALELGRDAARKELAYACV